MMESFRYYLHLFISFVQVCQIVWQLLRRLRDFRNGNGATESSIEDEYDIRAIESMLTRTDE